MRARAPRVHRAYSTQQSSVVMHTHVHTHAYICCARRGACTQRLCTHTHAQGSAHALVPPGLVHTDTHVPHAQNRGERATHTCRACAHQHAHTYTCETCLHTQSLYAPTLTCSLHTRQRSTHTYRAFAHLHALVPRRRTPPCTHRPCALRRTRAHPELCAAALQSARDHVRRQKCVCAELCTLAHACTKGLCTPAHTYTHRAVHIPMHTVL